MTNNAKQWKSCEEQLEILQARGMIVDDTAGALDYLRRVGYYRLSGYSYPFRCHADDGKSRRDEFIEGSRFEDVAALYEFDRKLRLLALDAIERIELAIQVEIAHLLGRRDTFAQHVPNFLDKSFVNKGGSFGYQHWLENYHSLVRRSKATFVGHNLAKYGKLPIWVAIEIWDFGALSLYFSGMKGRDKIAISEKFVSDEGKSITSWLRSLNYIRNISAHHSRLWNCNIVERAAVPKSLENLRTLNNARPFLYFCIMNKMLEVIDMDSSWSKRFVDLSDQFPTVSNGAVSLEDMGITEGWREWDMWK